MKKYKKDLIILFFFIILFIYIRSINYIYHLNWSGDQATQSAHVLELIRNKKYITLIGNAVDSFKYEGRFIYQGPATYYMLGAFLLLGKFDPVVSSYLFIPFCALMTIPLYFGMKWLMNLRIAWILVIIYTFSSYYINYTRFLWNPNFQFSLIPILFLLMGYFKKKNTILRFLALSIFLGILLQFHYQFIIAIAGLAIYYFIYKKLSNKYLLIYLIGLAIGLMPLIIFELRNNFYNLRTLILLLSNYSKVSKAGGINTPHYWLSSSFLILLLIGGFLGKIINNLKHSKFLILIVAVSIGLLLNSVNITFTKPQTAFWAPADKWNYLAEKKIYDIIKKINLTTNYNVTNQAYDNRAMVTKYFLKKDNINIDYDDYFQNKYLFVVYKGKNYQTDPIEIASLWPAKRLKSWKINDKYNMLLLERVK